jgi:signal transduction histidine kinase
VDYLDHFYQIGNFLHNIETCGERVAALVKGLKNYSRQDTETVAKVDLHQGLEETLMIFGNKLKHFNVIKEYSELPPVECRPAELNQVWTNLIANALDAMGKQGTLTIKTQMAKTSKNGKEHVQVLIEDDGPGIPPEVKKQIFEFHFTTKRGTRFGLGMGLAIAQQIIRRHGGVIQAKSEPGTFTRFIVTLPVVNPDISQLKEGTPDE